MTLQNSNLNERLVRLERLQNTIIVLALIVLFLNTLIALQVFAPELGSGIRAAFSPAGLSTTINNSFGPILKPIFQPIDQLLAGISSFPALSKVLPSLVAVGYFIGTMVWVFFGLKREFVNLNAPKSDIWHDLRFWTIVSMLPHVIVYLYFLG